VTEQSLHARRPPHSDADVRDGWSPLLILAALTLLAAALRFYRIGDWGVSSDEVFMLRDSITLREGNPRPLLYLLNHYLILPFAPLDEFGLRVLPAIFGVLAVPAVYLVTRLLVGTRAALFAGFLVATSSLLVYDSQFGRYWSLVFLLSSVYPYVLYLGFRNGNLRLLGLGLLIGVLAVLAHPVGVLPLGGLGVWILAMYLRRDRIAQLWRQRSVRYGAALALILGALIAWRFVPLLQAWIAQHDSIPQSERGGEFLFRIPGNQGIRQLSLLLAYVESLTVALVLAGVIGIYLLWRERDRGLAVLLACLVLAPILFISLVQTRTAVSTFYMSPATPALFIGAGAFLDRLVGADPRLRPRWLLAATVAVMIFAAGAPTLISQYRDGRRWDFRTAAQWLDERLTPGDVVFSDQPFVLAHYLPGKNVQRLLADPERLARAGSTLQQEGTLWVVAPAPSHAFRTNPKLNTLNDWMYNNCQLRNTIGVGRVDFRQNFLQIFRCPPVASVASSRRPTTPLGDRSSSRGEVSSPRR
jgi:mannosyltransferase